MTPSPLATSLLAGRLRNWVLRVFPRGQSQIDYDAPVGDPGLFGPDSATWRIHADFPGMLSGGLCALMLQTLHPRALAGVYDHSNFRDDLVGRLRRTTAFVAGTSYAGTDETNRLIARVAGIHTRVRGTLPDGSTYAADDPALLTWVHVTEAYGFLQGYRRYAPDVLPIGAADRYYDESRRVAEALGARDVPRSEAEVAAYFEAIQPQLHADARSHEVLGVLARIRLPVPMAGASRTLFLGAGAALLPEWAHVILGRTAWQRQGDRIAARMLARLGPVFRRALGDGVAPRACHRVGVSPDCLHRWPDVTAAGALDEGDGTGTLTR